MSRPWRIEYEGALYHLLSRGNQRSDIFMSDEDRSSFLDAVDERPERFAIDVFAYAMMDNHYLCEGSLQSVWEDEKGNVLDADSEHPIVIFPERFHLLLITDKE